MRIPKELTKAIKPLTEIQKKMALILYEINGKENAMEFISKLKE